MGTNHENSPFNNRQPEGNKFLIQLKKVYEVLKEKPMTMKEVDVYTGIMRENICRHIDNLLKQGRIQALRKRKCRITGYPYVTEYTADENLFQKSNQLELF